MAVTSYVPSTLSTSLSVFWFVDLNSQSLYKPHLQNGDFQQRSLPTSQGCSEYWGECTVHVGTP